MNAKHSLILGRFQGKNSIAGLTNDPPLEEVTYFGDWRLEVSQTRDGLRIKVEAGGVDLSRNCRLSPHCVTHPEPDTLVIEVSTRLELLDLDG